MMIAGPLIGIVALCAIVALVRAICARPHPVEVASGADLRIDKDEAAHRLAGAIALQTISRRAGEVDGDVLLRFHTYLETAFPHVASSLKRELINGYSLLYTWEGREPAQPPVLLLGHMDVVPVPSETERLWTHPPFGGIVDGGFVWGRGTLDYKVGVLGVLESVEQLVAQGFRPRRTVLLAFGHDEEVGGRHGGFEIASVLEKRGVKPALVLDEGLAVLEGMVPGVAAPVAAVGVAEKGYLNLELSVQGSGGHSSTPPKNTPAGILGRALARLEDRPMPATLEGPFGQMLVHLAPEARFPQRLVFSNLWLFGTVLKRLLGSAPATNAGLRTTVVPTMLNASVKVNVLPTKAAAALDVRIHPNDTIDETVKHVRRAVDDPRVDIAIANPDTACEPSPISSTDTAAFGILEKTIRQIFPRAAVAPSLVLGTTDARHFNRLSPSVFRFAPFRLTQEDLGRIHGIDERISVDDYGKVIRFYYQLLQNVEGLV